MIDGIAFAVFAISIKSKHGTRISSTTTKCCCQSDCIPCRCIEVKIEIKNCRTNASSVNSAKNELSSEIVVIKWKPRWKPRWKPKGPSILTIMIYRFEEHSICTSPSRYVPKWTDTFISPKNRHFMVTSRCFAQKSIYSHISSFCFSAMEMVRY